MGTIGLLPANPSGKLSNEMATDSKRYSPQEVRAVLGRAQRSEQDQSTSLSAGLTPAEVLETGKDLGFSEQQITAALLAHEAEERLGRAQKELRQIKYRRFSGHLILFLLGNGCFVATGIWATRPLWLLVTAGLWLTWLLLQLRGALFPNPDTLRTQARKRLAMQELQESGREFQTTITTGAAKLLSFSAKKIEQGVSRLDS